MLFTTLYGTDIINVSLKVVFEFLFYFVGSLLGAAIRACAIEKNRPSLFEVLGISLLISISMIVAGKYLQELKDGRLVFGIATLAGMYMPNFTNSLRNGNLLKAIVGIFSRKAKIFVEDLEGKKGEEE